MGVHSSFPPHELSKFSTPSPKDQTPQHLVLRTGCLGGIEGPEGRRTCATSSDRPVWDTTSTWGNSRTRIGWNGTSSKNQAGPNAIVARTRTIGRQEYRTSIQGTLQIQRYCEVITQRICRHRKLSRLAPSPRRHLTWTLPKDHPVSNGLAQLWRVFAAYSHRSPGREQVLHLNIASGCWNQP